jgi:hypothetical protein
MGIRQSYRTDTLIVLLINTSLLTSGQFQHITDKAANIQRIKRNEENVCECAWMLDGVWLVHLND